MDNLLRLQKYIAQAGVCSRRRAEELISQGMVTVNGRPVTEPGVKIRPGKDKVEVEGEAVKVASRKTTVLLYKPVGYVCTASDPQKRHTVQELVKGVPGRLFSVGRLDYRSEGLLLLTDDGDLAYALTHPKHRIEKVYLVKIRGVPGPAKLQQLRRGVSLGGRMSAPCKVNIVSVTENRNCWLEFILHEGRNRQLRRMIEAVRHTVLKLKRVQIAFLDAEGMSPGQYRILTKQEVRTLKQLAEQ